MSHGSGDEKINTISFYTFKNSLAASSKLTANFKDFASFISSFVDMLGEITSDQQTRGMILVNGMKLG